MSRAALPARRRRRRRATSRSGTRLSAARPAAGHRRADRARARRWRSSPSPAARPASSDAPAIGTALALGAFGLLPMAVTLLQLRVFYAMKDARTPTLIQAGMVAVRVPLLLLVPVARRPEHVVAGLMVGHQPHLRRGLGDRRRRAAPPARRPLRTRETLGPVARIAVVSAAAGRAGGWVVARRPEDVARRVAARARS